MYNFNYARPGTVADAAAALAAGAQTRVIVLAGGQTLIPTMKQRLTQPGGLIDLAGIGELRGIHKAGNAIGIGAMTTHAEVAGNADIRASLPALASLAQGIADPMVRNRGTIGGSLANNDPAADYPAAVLALGATIVTNKRQIKADDYFKGLFTTALEAGEIITGIGFPVADKAGYAKFEQRASRFALVGVFVAKIGQAVRVAVTGAGDGGVFRSLPHEQALAASWSPASAAAVKLPASNLMGDMHGSADYRASLISVMAERAVVAAG